MFFNKLKKYNNNFYAALHFCNPLYREKISALLNLVYDLNSLKIRITEPLLLSMRLVWWREQFLQEKIPDNSPPELKILHGIDMQQLFDCLEQQKHDNLWGEIFKLIVIICRQDDYQEKAFQLGCYYAQSLERQKNLDKSCYWPLSIRFLKITILLNKYSEKKFTLLYKMLKTMLSGF